MREFHLDSGDRGSHFEPGLNRDRLCGQGFVCLYTFISSHSMLCQGPRPTESDAWMDRRISEKRIVVTKNDKE